MSKKTYVDPFDYTNVYPILGSIVFVAIILNIVSCVIMMKNKDLRRHRQFLVYITISLTEIFIDLLYVVILFWRRESAEFFCMFIFLFYALGRENIQLPLLSLCIERCFALNMSLNNMFRKMITIKGRLTTFILCAVLSSLIMAPLILSYANIDSYACGPATLFGINSRFVLRYIRTVFSVQVLSMLVLYLYVTKKIHTLTSPNVQRTDASNLEPAKGISENKMETFNGSNPEKKETLCDTQPSSASTSQIVHEVKGGRKQPKHQPQQNNSKRQGGKWKPHTLNALRSAILTTVFPSIPMLGLQIVDYVNPNFMNTTHDVIISLCNVLHAVVFPLIFIVTVKKNGRTCICCKKSRNIDTTS